MKKTLKQQLTGMKPTTDEFFICNACTLWGCKAQPVRLLEPQMISFYYRIKDS